MLAPNTRNVPPAIRNRPGYSNAINALFFIIALVAVSLAVFAMASRGPTTATLALAPTPVVSTLIG
jgi:hypothetical protein